MQKILNTDKSHYRRKAKSMNMATLKPIRTKDDPERQQIVLMDMGHKGTVKKNNQLYRFMLTVIDMFNRFVWLGTLTSKSGKVVAKKVEGT